MKTFVKGERLTNLEKVLELEYLSQKYEKITLRKRYELNSNKIVLTDNDCLKLLCKRDIMIDFSRIRLDEYKTHIYDIFKVFRLPNKRTIIL